MYMMYQKPLAGATHVETHQFGKLSSFAETPEAVQAAPGPSRSDDRRKIMARAWQIARERPIAIGPAQKIAWAEAKGGNRCHMPTTVRLADTRGGALVSLRHHGALTHQRNFALVPLRRRFGRVWPLLITVARLESRFIPSRAA